MDGSAKMAGATFSRGPIATDITALCTAELSRSIVLLAGCGGNVLIYGLQQGQSSNNSLLLVQPALKGLRVQGIAAYPLPSTSATDQCLIVVHGTAKVQLWVLSLAASSSPPQDVSGQVATGPTCQMAAGSHPRPSDVVNQTDLQPLCSMQCILDLGQQEAWVMHALVQPWKCDPISTQQPSPSTEIRESAHRQPDSHLTLALSLGLINNRVQVWQVDLVTSTSSTATFKTTNLTAPAPAEWPTWTAQTALRQVSECSERCLLYSMQLNTGRGNPNAPTTWVAAGTIGGDVLIWATSPLQSNSSSSSPQHSAVNSRLQPSPANTGTTSVNSPQTLGQGQQQPPLLTVPPLVRLQGHRSSIFSVRWLGLGDISHLVSASDDRTSRVWKLHVSDQQQLQQQESQQQEGEGQGQGQNQGELNLQPQTDAHQVQGKYHQQALSQTCPPPAAAVSATCVTVLGGHTARVWDAALSRLPDGQIIAATGGEDCTIRLWVLPTEAGEHVSQTVGVGSTSEDTLSSSQQQPVSPACAAVLQGHRGRGVWRLALIDPPGSTGPLLFSGGADASIKQWWLPGWLPLTPSMHAGTGISSDSNGSGDGVERDAAAAQHLPTAALGHQGPGLQHLRLKCRLPGMLGAPVASKPAAAAITATADGATGAVEVHATAGSSTSKIKGRPSGQSQEKVKVLEFGHLPPQTGTEGTTSATVGQHNPTLPLYIGTTGGAIIAVKLQNSGMLGSEGQGVQGFPGSAPQKVTDDWELLYSDPTVGAVQCLTLSPCGTFLLAGTSRGAAVLLGLSSSAVHRDTLSGTLSGAGTNDTSSGAAARLHPTVWQAHQQGVLHVMWLQQPQGESRRELVATCDASSRIRFWYLPCVADTPASPAEPQLLAECSSPLGQPLLCFPHSPTAGLLVAGDYKGNLMGWALPCDLISSGQERVLTHYTGALGSSSSASGQDWQTHPREAPNSVQAAGGVAAEEAGQERHPTKAPSSIQTGKRPVPQLPLVLVHKGAHCKTPVRMIWLDDHSGRMVTGGGDHTLAHWVLSSPTATSLHHSAAAGADSSAPGGPVLDSIRLKLNMPAAACGPPYNKHTLPADSSKQASVGGSIESLNLTLESAGVQHLSGLSTPMACCATSNCYRIASAGGTVGVKLVEPGQMLGSGVGKLLPNTVPAIVPAVPPPYTVPPGTVPDTIPSGTVPSYTVPPHTVPPYTVPPVTVLPHTAPHQGGVLGTGAVSGERKLCLVAGFHGNQFRVVDMEADAEVLREECGGVHQPTAFLARSRDSLALAWYSQQDQALRVTLRGNVLQQHASVQSGQAPTGGAAADTIALLACGGEATSSADGRQLLAAPATTAVPASAAATQPPPPCQNLHLTHHGLETLCMAILPVPTVQKHLDGTNTSGAKSPQTSGFDCFSVLTGSEDSTLRQLVALRRHGQQYNSGTQWLPVFQQSSEIGEHAGGNAVRCLSVYPLSAGDSTADVLHSVGHGTMDVLDRPPASYLMVSGGAKESVNAWVLQADQGTPSHHAGSAGATNNSRLPSSQQSGLIQAAPNASGFSSRLLSSLPMSVLSAGQGKQSSSKQLRGKVKGHQVQGTHSQGHKRCLAVNVLGTVSDHIHGATAVVEATPSPSVTAHGSNRSTGQPRHTFPDSRSHISYLVALSISDASLRLLSVDLVTGRWSHITHLVHHTHPVLSLASIPLVMMQDSRQQSSGELDASRSGGDGEVIGSLLVSGATDGSVALWLASCSRESVMATNDSTSSTGTPSRWPQALHPMLTLPGVHLAGVNSLTLAWAREVPCSRSDGQCGAVTFSRLLALVTGGDDQALGVTLIRVTMCVPVPVIQLNQKAMAGAPGGCEPSSISASVVSRFTLPNAHTSSVRAVQHLELPGAPTGRQLVVVSAGLDQRVRAWGLRVKEAGGHVRSTAITQERFQADARRKVQEVSSGQGPAEAQSKDSQGPSATLEPLGSAVAEVPELCAIDAVLLGSAGTVGSHRAAIAVAGRGVQVLEMQLPKLA